MADFATARSIGARIAATRRARGYRSPADLRDVLAGTGLTPAVLANIESGRKVDLSISQVLNLAKVLQVPVSFLLAPMARPSDLVDLPNLVPEIAKMTASEFDAWFSSLSNASYTPGSPAERTDHVELKALRELRTLERELARLKVVDEIEASASRPAELAEAMSRRIANASAEIEHLRKFLVSAGWDV